MAEPAGGKNAYTCLACGLVVVTVNRDEGTTPMFINCQAPGCGDKMGSSFYRLPPNAPEPTLEWYRPSKRQTKRLPAWQRDHVERGGLLYREVKR